VESRDKLIASLQADGDELRKTRRHLREAEAEIQKIKILSAPGMETPEMVELRQAFNDKEKAIGALSVAVQKRDKTIAKLTEEAETWHERYQKLQEKFPGLSSVDEKVSKPSAKKA
jgi:prefoldin subunit 5